MTRNDATSRLVALARRFPSLRDAVGLDPWNAALLDKWACSELAPCAQSMAAAQFVLFVADPRREWKCGRFEPSAAMLLWDEAHLAAYSEWVKAPWHPMKQGTVISFPRPGRFCQIDDSAISCQTCPQRQARENRM